LWTGKLSVAPSFKLRRLTPLTACTTSGYNQRKLEQQVEASGRVHTRFRRPELFKRINAAQLASALHQTPPSEDCLLLDLRSIEHFSACHVRKGVFDSCAQQG
jgi:hypothetical protein